ncbi:hypothetical protein [Streptomyces bobili]
MQGRQVGDEVQRLAERAVGVPLAGAAQESVALQLVQSGGDGVDAFAAAAHQVGDGDLPAVTVRGDVAENPLRLERQPRVPEQAVGDLRELIDGHDPAADARREAGIVFVFDRKAGGGFRQVGGGGAVGDRVDDVAECAVRAAQPFADQIAAAFEFLQAGTDRLASVGTHGNEVGEGDQPAVAMRGNVPEDPLRPERQPEVPEQAVGDLRELIGRHHTPADPRPQAAHHGVCEAGRPRCPGQRSKPARVRRAAGLGARSCVYSMPSAHPPTPTRAAATNPDHRSPSGNAAVELP